MAIVDPDTFERLPPDQIGEMWVHGPVVTDGYWKRPGATEEIFGATIQGEGDKRWLRTGDLGFVHDGEVVITGRRKDLLIIRGRNIYPQDVEVTAEKAHIAVRPGSVAAFSGARWSGGYRAGGRS